MGLEGRQHVEVLLCVPGVPAPILSQPTRQSREGCAKSHAMGAVCLEGFELGHDFTNSELFFHPSAGLDKSGPVSLHQTSSSMEGRLGKCL